MKTRMDTDAILATSVVVSVAGIAIVSLILTYWDALCGYPAYVEDEYEVSV